jgi:hypothetical protein
MYRKQAWIALLAATLCGPLQAQQEDKLIAFGGSTVIFDYFGASLAMQGETLIISAPGGPHSDVVGAVYVMYWNGSSWQQQTKLIASDGAPDDLFGGAVAIDGDTLAVTGSGSFALYIFEWDGSGYLARIMHEIWHPSEIWAQEKGRSSLI